MSRILKTELVIEGYRAEVTRSEITVTATGRSYDQRDERAYQVSLIIPTKDAKRVAGLLADAAAAAGAMSA